MQIFLMIMNFQDANVTNFKLWQIINVKYFWYPLDIITDITWSCNIVFVDVACRCVYNINALWCSVEAFREEGAPCTEFGSWLSESLGRNQAASMLKASLTLFVKDWEHGESVCMEGYTEFGSWSPGFRGWRGYPAGLVLLPGKDLHWLSVC